ncbi:unnamed protein product, partial [Prorocentrum cordatum]
AAWRCKLADGPPKLSGPAAVAITPVVQQESGEWIAKFADGDSWTAPSAVVDKLPPKSGPATLWRQEAGDRQVKMQLHLVTKKDDKWLSLFQWPNNVKKQAVQLIPPPGELDKCINFMKENVPRFARGEIGKPQFEEMKKSFTDAIRKEAREKAKDLQSAAQGGSGAAMKRPDDDNDLEQEWAEGREALTEPVDDAEQPPSPPKADTSEDPHSSKRRKRQKTSGEPATADKQPNTAIKTKPPNAASQAQLESQADTREETPVTEA